ncbi:hypothetical protein PV325_008685, partial [Microctonus aethiopoides]
MLDRVWVKDDGKEIKKKKSENKKAPLLVEFIRTRMTLEGNYFYYARFFVLPPDVWILMSAYYFQDNLEERVHELEKILQNERVAAQRDRATITKLQRQINK